MSTQAIECWFAGQQLGVADTPVGAWRLLGVAQPDAERLAASAVISGGHTVGIGAVRLTAAGSDRLAWRVADATDADYMCVGPSDDGTWVAAWCDACDRVATEAEADELCAARIESTGKHWLAVRRRLALRH